jgi:NADH:ubiquinone oxidoreductase subunit E
MDKKHKICICLGRSCFSKGNEKNLEIIKSVLQNHSIKESVEFRGSVCNGQCENGPTIKINDEFIKFSDAAHLQEALIEKLL